MYAHITLKRSSISNIPGGRIRSFGFPSLFLVRALVLPYLLQDLLVLGRVVLQGLVGRRGDNPLALLELLGLRLGRHFGGAG